MQSQKRLSAGLVATRRGTADDIKLSNEQQVSQARRDMSRRSTATGKSFGSAGGSGEVLSRDAAIEQVETLKVNYGINDEQVSSRACLFPFCMYNRCLATTASNDPLPHRSSG